MGIKVNHKGTKSLRKKAWKLVSEYVRRSEKGICFTCGVQKNYKEMQCGHYIHKDCLDYTLINLHCQCPRCNKFLSGNLGVYAERLIAEYGEDAIHNLRVQSQEIKKFTIDELEQIINKFKTLLSEMD